MLGESLGLHVRGQVVQTWLISPETLVGYLLSRRGLVIRALSHLIRTGRTRLGRRHPRWLLRGLAECVHLFVCLRLTPNQPKHPPSIHAYRRGTNGIRTCSTPNLPTDRKTSQTRHHPIVHTALILDAWRGTVQNADAKLVNFYVCVNLCQFVSICVCLCLLGGVSSCV